MISDKVYGFGLGFVATLYGAKMWQWLNELVAEADDTPAKLCSDRVINSYFVIGSLDVPCPNTAFYIDKIVREASAFLEEDGSVQEVAQWSGSLGQRLILARLDQREAWTGPSHDGEFEPSEPYPFVYLEKEEHTVWCQAVFSTGWFVQHIPLDGKTLCSIYVRVARCGHVLIACGMSVGGACISPTEDIIADSITLPTNRRAEIVEDASAVDRWDRDVGAEETVL